MNQVVNFLSLLAVTEEQGGVKRMLGVCAEFERIARVVLERGDKESHSRRKRRSSKLNETETPHTPQQVPQKRTAPQTPVSNNPPTPQNIFTPGFNGDLNNQAFNSNLQAFSPSLSNMDLALDFSGAEFNPNMMTASNGMQGFSNGDMNGQQYSGEQLNMGSFQQPFVPQDLWQMPMTLEWDWADMGGGMNGFPAAFDGGQPQGQDNVMNTQGPM